MKILYLSTWDFTEEISDGVCKKIKSQISVFEKQGYQVDITYIKQGTIIYRQDGIEKEIGSVGAIKKTLAYIKMYQHLKNSKYDWIYNRYGMMDTFYYRLLKRLHKNGAKILMEIPTYPYTGERPKGILYWLMFKWDEIYSNRLKKIVYRIATYSLDNVIYGVKTIIVCNGVDFSKIRLKEKKKENEIIDLIGVARLSVWHGFDRVIEGMRQYYSLERNGKIIRFHIVGEGEVLQEYKQLVKEYDLENYVLFYGNQTGKELEQIYDQSDIAVSSLGLHRIGVKGWASVLKSREYAAKGMPIISSVPIDIFDRDEFKYIKYFSEDESPIDMNSIIDFYNEIIEKKGDIRTEIRDYAYKKCDKTVVMKPVIECFERMENE